MGHFGRSAIRISWFAFVAPALVLVYLGQGALVLADPAAAENPFFLLFPTWLLAPAILLTTAATVIASQAVACPIRYAMRRTNFADRSSSKGVSLAMIECPSSSVPSGLRTHKSA